MSAGIARLARDTGWPRWVLRHEAMRLGITTWQGSRPWTAEEDAALRERAGVVSVYAIAQRLGRSHLAVQRRARGMALSLRVVEGYAIQDLADVLGAHHTTVRRWMDGGLFGPVHAVGGAKRVHEANVRRFLRRHAGVYDLRRVDQVWFKAVLFADESQRPAAPAGPARMPVLRGGQ